MRGDGAREPNRTHTPLPWTPSKPTDDDDGRRGESTGLSPAEPRADGEHGVVGQEGAGAGAWWEKKTRGVRLRLWSVLGA